LEILIENAINKVTFEHKGNTYCVDNLLTLNFMGNNKMLMQEVTQCSQIINDLLDHTINSPYDPSDLVGIASIPVDNGDQYEWLQHIIINVASDGFNHVVNYCNFRNKISYQGKPIEIVLGFLVLESHNGNIRMPTVDTEKELFEKYYTLSK